MGDVTFNGVTASSLGLVVQAPPEEVYAEKDIELTHIKGRNGDLLVDNKSYLNTVRKYSFACAFDGPSAFLEKAKAIAKWLHPINGYAVLSDTYSDCYRMAVVKNEGSFINAYDQGTAFTVEFECKPQKFLSAGDIYSIVLNDGNWYKFTNTSGQISRPEISFDAKVASPNVDHIVLKNSGIEYYRDHSLDITQFAYGWRVVNESDIPNDTYPSKKRIITRAEYPNSDTVAYYWDSYAYDGILQFIDMVNMFIPAGYRFQFIVARSNTAYQDSEHWIVSIDTSVSFTGVINSELMECYDYNNSVPYLINNRVIINGYEGFPVFYPGDNYVKITLANSQTAELKIKPKYWYL